MISKVFSKMSQSDAPKPAEPRSLFVAKFIFFPIKSINYANYESLGISEQALKDFVNVTSFERAKRFLKSYGTDFPCCYYDIGYIAIRNFLIYKLNSNRVIFVNTLFKQNKKRCVYIRIVEVKPSSSREYNWHDLQEIGRNALNGEETPDFGSSEACGCVYVKNRKVVDSVRIKNASEMDENAHNFQKSFDYSLKYVSKIVGPTRTSGLSFSNFDMGKFTNRDVLEKIFDGTSIIIDRRFEGI